MFIRRAWRRMDDAALRAEMVESQIVARGVQDPRVLAAMRSVPRHLFVPRSVRYAAYEDGPLPIGQAQTISQPYMVAVMSELLRLTGAEHVLEIGTGSGYQTAVLSALCAQVVSVERHASLSARAGERLARLGIANVRLVVGDGSLGWPEAAPYDAVLLTALAPLVPEPYREQLKVGGRLVMPIVECESAEGYTSRLVRIVREPERWVTERLFPVAFVPLIGVHGFRGREGG